ncbi:MAG: hypothetical protein ACOX6H_03865 [Christensenellales bacterium]|jgi:hypothetical protein
MKRKFKLISSIASLTAAVALLAVGVFAAATARTIDVTGTVGFTASNIAATVKIYETVDGVMGATPIKTLVYTTDGKIQVDGATATTDNYAQQTFTGLLDVSLTDSVLFYSYKIVIENDFEAGGSSIVVTLTDKASSVPTWVTPVVASGSTIAANAAPVEYVYSYTVNPDLAPQNASFNIGVNVSMVRENAQS